MPITSTTYNLIHQLSAANVVADNPHILELGESNWYGDVPLKQLKKDIHARITQPELLKKLLSSYTECESKLSHNPPIYTALWELSRIFYKTMLNYSSYAAIDLSGSDAALKLDLNTPITLERQYQLVIDFGTAEHVFNILQLFKTVHEVTSPGGIMLHGLPFHGWIDHGFYNFHPTFFLDLAAANNYTLISLLYRNVQTNKITNIHNREQITQLFNSKSIVGSGSLFATFKKSDKESDFQIPMQGYYTRSVSESVISDWHSNR